MTKKAQDLILRDRMQFTLDAQGDVPTQYGRFSLEDFVSVTDKKGFAIDEVYFQVRNPGGETNTGVFTGALLGEGTAANADATLKLTCGNVAYENMTDIGIGSPNIVYIEEFGMSYYDDGTAATQGTPVAFHSVMGPSTLQPSGFVTASDLLIGIAANDCTNYADLTLELDVLIIGHQVTLTAGQLTQMLTQGLDN